MTAPTSDLPSPPPFVAQLLGYRDNGHPNTSDAASRPSRDIAREINDLLGVPEDQPGPLDPGAGLEHSVRDWLAAELAALAPHRQWEVDHKRVVSDFAQYEHLARLQAIIRADETNTLKAEIGEDYIIRPDVTVGLDIDGRQLLHASVSCKWTGRSDRLQNVRHEAVILTRHRRGRQPHIVVVTAEPLPTRIAAVARGTGEIDGVYHVALHQLRVAVEVHGSAEQRAVLDELTGQQRLFDLCALPQVLVV